MGTGPGKKRIPDLQVYGPNGSIAKRNTIVEVKNVAKLRTTKQLRDLLVAAEKEGAKLEIFTRIDTIIPPPSSQSWLREMIDAGRILHVPGVF